MVDQEGKSLIEMGLRQGVVLPISALNDACRDALLQNRAVPEERASPLPDFDNGRLIVLSQDCDIHSAQDDYVELVLACKCPKNGAKATESLKGARNTRKLHLFFEGCYWELRIEHISSVPKHLLVDVDSSQICPLPAGATDQVITWRINRYYRAPLPDAFNRVFIAGLRNPANPFRVFLEKHRDDILDLYVFVAPDTEDAKEYFVSVTMVVAENSAVEFVDECTQTLLEYLSGLSQHDGPLRFIQLDQDAIKDELGHTLELVARPNEFALADLMQMKRLAVDYLCFPGG